MERNLTAHEPHSPLPCLCKRCLPGAPERASSEGLSFHRMEARGGDRVLYAWVPDELAQQDGQLKANLERRLQLRARSKYGPTPSLPGAQGAQPEGFFKRLGRFFGLS